LAENLENYLIEPFFPLDFLPNCIHNVYVRIVGILILQDFWNNHPEARTPLEEWVEVVKNAKWFKWADVKSTFGTASWVQTRTEKFVVFNVSGNKYRLITVVNFKGQVVVVGFALTHGEYDKGKWKR
jgi:mRNA interferase HigB